ncbi:hypothetical protein ACVWZ3_005546 [Bradyrhizobium sp. i1.3.6]
MTVALSNMLDVVKIKLFPPNYDAWITKSHKYKERLASSGAAYADQWRPLDRLSFADYSGDIINASHQHLADAPLGHQGVEFLIELGITGYLRRGDALKLYDLAFRAPGDILEAGTNKGLSTSILAQAVHDRGHGSIETIELDRENSSEAERNLTGRPGSERVTFTVSDATRRMSEPCCGGEKVRLHFHRSLARISSYDRCRRTHQKTSGRRRFRHVSRFPRSRECGSATRVWCLPGSARPNS